MSESENHDPTVIEDETPEGAGAEGTCPVVHGRVHPTKGDANYEWWPNKLNLKILAKNPAEANPMGADFSYAEAFSRLDPEVVTVPDGLQQRDPGCGHSQPGPAQLLGGDPGVGHDANLPP